MAQWQCRKHSTALNSFLFCSVQGAPEFGYVHHNNTMDPCVTCVCLRYRRKFPLWCHSRLRDKHEVPIPDPLSHFPNRYCYRRITVVHASLFTPAQYEYCFKPVNPTTHKIEFLFLLFFFFHEKCLVCVPCFFCRYHHASHYMCAMPWASSRRVSCSCRKSNVSSWLQLLNWLLRVYYVHVHHVTNVRVVLCIQYHHISL